MGARYKHISQKETGVRKELIRLPGVKGVVVVRFNIMSKGQPTDLFLQINVLQENVCLLGDVKEMICPWKESVAGKRAIQGLDRITDMFYLSETFSLMNFGLKPHPISYPLHPPPPPHQ